MTDPYMAQELTTYLTCPRQYELECVSELSGDAQQSYGQFRQLLRDAICTGYSEARSAGANPYDAAVKTLESEWGVYAGTADHHSTQQETTEKNRAQAALEAYFDEVGSTHLERIEQADTICGSPVIGPDLTLTTTIEGQQVGVEVDYIMADDNRIVGVRLTDRMWGLKVPYESKDEIAEKHLDEGEYHPGKVGTVLTARIAEQALSEYGSSETGAELTYLSVMEEVYETGDECETVVDQRPMGQFLAGTRPSVDAAIAWMSENMDNDIYNPEQVFDEQDHWDGAFEQVVENTCESCSYAAGCQEAICREVMFNV